VSDAAAALPFFRALAPEFGPKGPTRKSDDEALVMLGIKYPDALEDFDETAASFCKAVARLAAHEFTMQNRVVRSLAGFAATGPVASYGVKGFNASHTPAQSPAESHEDDELRQTTHGLKYLRIRDKCAVTFGVLC